MTTFDDRELATVLAALRHFQKRAMVEYPDHFFDVDPLDDSEIDALCERINCEPIEQEAA